MLNIDHGLEVKTHPKQVLGEQRFRDCRPLVVLFLLDSPASPSKQKNLQYKVDAILFQVGRQARVKTHLIDSHSLKMSLD